LYAALRASLLSALSLTPFSDHFESLFGVLLALKVVDLLFEFEARGTGWREPPMVLLRWRDVPPVVCRWRDAPAGVLVFLRSICSSLVKDWVSSAGLLLGLLFLGLLLHGMLSLCRIEP
jgi:hypothetical protein